VFGRVTFGKEPLVACTVRVWREVPAKGAGRVAPARSEGAPVVEQGPGFVRLRPEAASAEEWGTSCHTDEEGRYSCDVTGTGWVHARVTPPGMREATRISTATFGPKGEVLRIIDRSGERPMLMVSDPGGESWALGPLERQCPVDADTTDLLCDFVVPATRLTVELRCPDEAAALAGARVLLRRIDAPRGEGRAVVSETGPDASVRLVGLPPGPWQVSVSPLGHQAARGHMDLRAGVAPQVLRLDLTPHAGVRARVFDADRTAGGSEAPVRLRLVRLERVGSARAPYGEQKWASGERLRWLQVPPGAYLVISAADVQIDGSVRFAETGFGSDGTVRVEAARVVEIDVRRETRCLLEIHVRPPASASGARVVVRPAGCVHPTIWGELTVSARARQPGVVFHGYAPVGAYDVVLEGADGRRRPERIHVTPGDCVFTLDAP